MNPIFNMLAKGDESTVHIDRIFFAIHLDRNAKQKFQTAIPDIIGAEHKWLNPRGAHEYEVFPVEAEIPHFGKLRRLYCVVFGSIRSIM